MQNVRITLINLTTNSNKLESNSNNDCIETYTANSFEEPKQKPVTVQGFRQSRARIKTFCEINSSFEEDGEIVETTPQTEHIVVAEVYISDADHD